MAHFDTKDWKDLKEILKEKYWLRLQKKWVSLGQNKERMLEYLKQEREEYKKRKKVKNEDNF